MTDETRRAGGRDGLHVQFAARGGEVLSFAAGELAQGIGRMLGEPVDVSGSYEIESPQLLILLGRAAPLTAPKLDRASYSISPSPTGIALCGGSEGAVLHAVYKF